MVLIESRPEGSSAGASRAGGLLTSSRAHGGPAHKVRRFIVIIGLGLAGMNSPGDHGDGTDQDRTADTHHHTDDDLLLIA